MVPKPDQQQAGTPSEADAPLLVLERRSGGGFTTPPMLLEMVPFLLIAVAVVLLIPGTPETRAAGGLVITLLAVCRGYAAVHNVDPRTRVLPAVVCALSIGVLAAISGEQLYDVILCLNVLLVALQESRRSVAVVLAATALALIVPAVLHPHALGLRAMVWAVLLPVLSFPIQRRAQELRERVAIGPQLRALQAEMLAAGDPRRALVSAAPRLTSCDIVALAEPDSSGRFVISEASREDLMGFAIPDDEGSLVRRAVKQQRPILVPDARADLGLISKVTEYSEISSWLCAPVTRGGFVAGVLCVGWIEPVRRSDDLRIDIVRSLASEASTTIDHTDLLQSLSDTASSDKLTGLTNRRGWDIILDAEIAASRRRGTPLAVAIIDLDHFKRFNDVHGHRAGDRLLREAAGAWTAALRAGDQLARWGGEEFTVVLPNCSAHAAFEVVERLRSCTPGEQTCSAGIAAWDGVESPTSLFERMDQALYEAKTNGRDSSILAPYPFDSSPAAA